MPAEIYRRIFFFMAYADLLKDPRWQRKRLEIMQRDEFRCQLCWDPESELHVHHKKYIKDFMPWDYPNVMMITLCKNCHCLISIKPEKVNKSDTQIKEILNFYENYNG